MTTQGNSDFQNNVLDSAWGAGNYQLYNSTAELNVLKYILSQVDLNGDHHISQAEINSCKIVMAGYSWGGVSAIRIAQMLNKTGSHTFGVKHHPSDPTVTYTVDAPIPVATLVTIDPCKFARPDPGAVPSNVTKYVNWYQTKKGNSVFTDSNCCSTSDPFGNTLSRRLSGYNPTSNAGSTTAVNVTTSSRWNYRDWQTSPLHRLFGKNVNHDLMPFFVGNCLNTDLNP